MAKARKPAGGAATEGAPAATTAGVCIAGVGASAGGLAALQDFFREAAKERGIAYVVVQHLDPSSESQLAHILARATTLRVQDAKDGQRVEADHVYVLPAGKGITMERGALRLHERHAPRGSHLPIDTFFESLAQDQGERAIGVILTGSGSDGTEGVKAIKEQGGLVVAQDPETAEHTPMPRSAVATGLVDLVLPLAEIPSRVAKYARGAAARSVDERGVADMVSVLGKQGVRPDFGAYRTATVARRLRRRIALVGDDDVAPYLRRLGTDADERARLRGDLLIGVTGFFREPEAFEDLAKNVVPLLFKGNEAVRVWVAGCSTGEEAYSVAMLLLEHRQKVGSDVSIQVFATDVNDDALAAARQGLYTEADVASLSEERRRRFFDREGRGHRVKRELRQVIAFATHDLLRDPPFARLGLVSCRNVLIYLRPEAQRGVLEMFHSALRPGGHLFLGASENAARLEGAFTQASSKWRIYRRNDVVRQEPRRPEPPVAQGPAPAAWRPRRQDAKDVAREWLLRRFTPAALAIDEEGLIVYMHGDLDRYLAFPEGQPRLDLLAMAREGLRPRLRAAIHQARRDGIDVRLTDVPVQHAGKTLRVDVRVQQARPHDGPALLLVTFEGRAETADEEAVETLGPDVTDQRLLAELEDELRATKAQLADTLASSEASNEELRAHGEEMASTNEELRTTVEELEASKEELDSLNEELHSTNVELGKRMEEARALADDLENLYAGTDIPALFLDPDLRIRRHTPAAARLFALGAGDPGRPIADVRWRFRDEELVDDARRVLERLAPIEREIRSDDGVRHLRRILAYRTADARIAGVVLTFHDIESLKRTEDELRASQAYSEAVIAAVPTPLAVIDEELRVSGANRAFHARFGRGGQEIIGRYLTDVMGPQWDLPQLRELAQGGAEQVFGAVEIQQATSEGTRTLLLDAYPMPAVLGKRSVLISVQDITRRKASERAQVALTGRLHRRVEERTADLLEKNRVLDNFSYMVGHDLKEPIRAMDGLLTMLEEDHGKALPPEGQAVLAQMRGQTKRLSSLVLGLLAFSRASRTDLSQVHPVSVRAALASDDCATRFRHLLAERKARLTVDGEDVLVLASFPAMGYILGNLVQNALLHNPSPDPWVRVSTRPPKKGLVEVVVEDNGPGLPQDVTVGLENMSAATRGFGLIIAQRTVAFLGGTLWLGTTEEGGAAVHFTLPAAKEPATPV